MDLTSDQRLHDIGLLSDTGNAPFDKLTRLAGEMLSVPVVLVSVVMPDEDRQFFKSAVGLAEPWMSRRQTPLSHSFCKYVRASDAPLVITDARIDPRVRHNGAVSDLGVVAYAGFPIHGPGQNAIGAFCLIDGAPREWTDAELRIISEFAAVADDQIRLLAAMLARDEALAAEREAAAAKARFFAMMSHEVRTPLSGILGMTEVLLDQVSEPDHLDMLKTIQSSGRSLLHILNDLLDMAKAEAGKLRLENEAFDLRELLTRVAALHRAAARAKGLKLMLDLAPDLPKMVHGDHYRLQQILNNLISNAVKFTAHGAITLGAQRSLDAGVAPGAGVGIDFRISDTGIGMTDEQMTRLFLPFEQADNGTTRRYGGTGLGLFIVAKLVDLMGGRVNASSRFGMGTTFDLCLPFCPEASKMALLPEPAHDTAAEDHVLAGLHVLVADDNATNRKLLSLFLRRAGAMVDLVENGRLAVEHALTRHYDALLFDISMPVLDGLNALEQIGASLGQRGQRCPPSVAITANAAPEDEARYRTGGFDGVTTKPFTRHSLLDAVRQVLLTR